MLRYETLLLAKTELTDDDASMIERQFDKIISEAQGKLDLFDRWGKYRLAYPVKKSTHGVFVLARYQLPTDKAATILQAIDDFLKLKCNELVMRHINVNLKANSSTSYIKPDPIDVSRSSSLDNFFKENKIESLLNSVDTNMHGNGRDQEDEKIIDNEVD